MRLNETELLAKRIKRLKEAIKASDDNPMLYETEELIFMKRSLSKLLTVQTQARQIQNGGLGYDV